MKQEVRALRERILKGESTFLDTVVEQMEQNKILFNDNIGVEDIKTVEDFKLLEPFMQLLYIGSKHSKGRQCEQGFTRIIEHKGILLQLTYNSGPEVFITVEKLEGVPNRIKVVTLDLLQIRLQEEEDLKKELRPVIESYKEAGLTYEEITRIFVDIMRERSVKVARKCN